MKYIQLNPTFYLRMLLRFFILTIGPKMWTETKLRTLTNQSRCFIDLRYSDFAYHVVQIHASDISLNEIMDVSVKKSSENSSKITCYANCPDVLEEIKPFTTTRWNTFLKSVDIRKGLVGNQAKGKGIFAWSWRYSTKWNDSNKT